MPTTARTLLCAVPQPPEPRKNRKAQSLRLFLACGVIAGFQALTAGPAAVATLPSALVARPFAVAPVTTAPKAEAKAELPKTGGGASLLALGAGALLVGGGLVARRIIK